ncbi:protein 4.2 isoform X1 [Pogona vitticeps]
MGQALQVKRCDVQAAGNNQAHHTAAISTERLVVRRGQPFALTLHFGSPVPGGGLRQLRRTSLVAQTGPRPSKADGSLVEIPISRLDNWTGWEAAVDAQDASSWSLVVTAPPDAPVGHYALLLRHVSALGQATQCPLASFALLFNPWCRGDSVFLPNEAQRQEYVLNQDGTIYWGLEEAPQEQPWDFGQVGEGAFPGNPGGALRPPLWSQWAQLGASGPVPRGWHLVAKLLRGCVWVNTHKGSAHALGGASCPWLCLRSCSQLTSPFGAQAPGAAFGEGLPPREGLRLPAPGGRSGGSPLLAFRRHGGHQPGPAGGHPPLLAAGCNAAAAASLGAAEPPPRLPPPQCPAEQRGTPSPPGGLLDGRAQRRDSPFPMARQPPHPAPVAGHPMPARPLWAGLGICCGPVLRPFRVWNECWMSRQDLEPGYHGWQAIDATPQDTGRGLHCCGPAPVKAIREGRLDLPYDVATFFAATNATCVPWVRLESGALEPAFSSPKYVGNHISTKGVGSERCEDITHNYKAPEGSAEETAVLEKAWQTLAERQEPGRGGTGCQAPPWLRPGAQAEVEAEEPLLLFARLQAEESSLALGRDARLSVAVASASGRDRPLQVVLGAQALRYDGRALQQFWKEEFHVTVRDRHEHVLRTTLPYAEYGPALKSSLLMKVTALVRDRPPLSTRSPVFLAWQEIHLAAPGLLVQIPESVTQFQPTEAKVQLHNPLPEPLADCVVSVSGRGLVHKERSYRLGPIEAGATRHLSIPFTPTQAGARRLTIHVGSSSLLQPRRTLETIRVAPAAKQSSPLSREAQ